MSKIKWDADGEKLFETGVRNGVLYVVGSDGTYGTGVAWNGLASVTESPSGAEETPLYADDIKYGSLFSAETYGGTIEAFMYPDEFAACNGESSLGTGVTIGQQKRATFAFCYRTIVGNDTLGEDYGYKLHIVYGAKVSPSERTHQTVNDSPEVETLSWEFTTTPVAVEGMKPTAVVTIDSTKFTSEDDKSKLKAIEDKLYGTDGTTTSGTSGTTTTSATEPTLITPDEIKAILSGTDSGTTTA